MYVEKAVDVYKFHVDMAFAGDPGGGEFTWEISIWYDDLDVPILALETVVVVMIAGVPHDCLALVAELTIPGDLNPRDLVA